MTSPHSSQGPRETERSAGRGQFVFEFRDSREGIEHRGRVQGPEAEPLVVDYSWQSLSCAWVVLFSVMCSITFTNCFLHFGAAAPHSAHPGPRSPAPLLLHSDFIVKICLTIRHLNCTRNSYFASSAGCDASSALPFASTLRSRAALFLSRRAWAWSASVFSRAFSFLAL